MPTWKTLIGVTLVFLSSVFMAYAAAVIYAFWGPGIIVGTLFEVLVLGVIPFLVGVYLLLTRNKGVDRSNVEFSTIAEGQLDQIQEVLWEVLALNLPQDSTVRMLAERLHLPEKDIVALLSQELTRSKK